MVLRFIQVLEHAVAGNAERIAVSEALENGIGKVSLGSVGKEYATETEQALAFWAACRESVERIRDAEESVTGERKLTNFDAFLCRMAYLRRFELHPNPLVRLVADFETLSANALRRVLWFANVDFQSFESFLKRITPDQIEVFRENAASAFELAMERCGLPHEKTDDLPCFRLGWQNAVANRFGPKSRTGDWWKERLYGKLGNRYESKAAIAHDILGWNFGFQLYSDAKTEKKNPESLPEQALLSKRGEDFSVNTESRGAYWWLYRTLRSNLLWGKDDEVELRAHVCPGFWMTVFAWLFLVAGSPACLVAGFLFGDALWGVPAYALFVPGAATPLLGVAFAFAWFVRKFGRQYDKEFVGASAFLAGGVLAVGFAGHHLHALANWLDWSEPLNWLIAAFLPMWFGYWVSNKDPNPWKMPVLGPLFLTAITLRGAYASYDRYPEETLQALKIVGIGIAALAGVAAIVVIGHALLWSLKAMLRYVDDMASDEKKTASDVNRLSDGGVTEKLSRHATRWAAVATVSWLAMFGFVIVTSLVGSVAVSGESFGILGLSLLWGTVTVTAYLGCFFAVSAWGSTGNYLSLRQETVEAAAMASVMYGGFDKENPIVRAFLSNPLFRKGYCLFDVEKIKLLTESANFWRCYHEISDADYAEAIRAMTEERLGHFLAAKTKPRFLFYVASGLRYSEARKAYLADREKTLAAEAASRFERQKRRENKKAVSDFFLFLPRSAWKLVASLAAVKTWFDNLCPRYFRPKPVN